MRADLPRFLVYLSQSHFHSQSAAGAASESRIVVIEKSNQLLSGENSCWEMENGWVRSHAKCHTFLEIHAVLLANVLYRGSKQGVY